MIDGSDIDFLKIILFPCFAGDADFSRSVPFPFSEQYDGTTGEKGGDGGRFDFISVKAVIAYLDIGQEGSLDIGAKLRGCVSGILLICDDECLTLSGLGDSVDQIAVDGISDAEGEEIRAAKISSYNLKLRT